MSIDELLNKLRKIIITYELLRSPGGRTIALPSGKGGVGKTLVTLHLSAALSLQGFSVAALDFNFALPNLQFYAKELPSTTITHYLCGLCDLDDIEYVKVKVGNSYIHVYPSKSIVDLERKIDLEKLPNLLKNVKTRYDYIVLDLSPGISKYSMYPIMLADCVFVVTADEKASYLDATKLSKILEVNGIYIKGYIVNKVEKKVRVNLDKVVCKIPFDQKIRNFPEVWSKKILKPNFLKCFVELAELVVQVC